MSQPVPPDYMYSGDGPGYYVLRMDTIAESVFSIGTPDEFDLREIWLRPFPISSLDPDDRADWMDEAATRDKNGRFQTNFYWEECASSSAGAVAYYHASYKKDDTDRHDGKDR